MRKSLLIAALTSAAFWMGCGHGFAEQQAPQADSSTQQGAPNAPQPQKRPSKPASAKSSASSSGADRSSTASSGQAADHSSTPGKPSAQTPSAKPHPASSDNPFPEDVSRKAAQAAGDAPPNPTSPQPAGTKPSSAAPHSAAEKNAFPEDVSRKAAQAAGKSSADTAGDHVKAPLPSDESSSQASSLTGGLSNKSPDAAGVADPIRAKKDNSVGDFYMGQGDYKGAFLRYQDAMKSDPGDIDAVFGAAEAARRLGNVSEAARDYQMYLEIQPDGSKAKRALKALRELPAKK